MRERLALYTGLASIVALAAHTEEKQNTVTVSGSDREPIILEEPKPRDRAKRRKAERLSREAEQRKKK